MYPFIPAHVTRPKECKKLYFIQLPRSSVFGPTFVGMIRLLTMCRGPQRSKEHEAPRCPLVRTV